jgi:hypothetical protein
MSWPCFHLLVVANGFCRDAGGACKLTNRQWSFHSPFLPVRCVWQERHTFQWLEGQGDAGKNFAGIPDMIL